MQEEYRDLVPMFEQMAEAVRYSKSKKRKKRGSIDFDFPESQDYS
ncbi:MAG: hypothetical protein ACLU80_08905 [Dorea sp.]